MCVFPTPSLCFLSSQHTRSLSPIRRPRHSCGMIMPGWISPPCTRPGYLCTGLCPWLMGNCQTLAHHPDRTIGLLLFLPRWSEAGLPLAITGTFCFKPAGSSWGPSERILLCLGFISTVSATTWSYQVSLGFRQPRVLTWCVPTVTSFAHLRLGPIWHEHHSDSSRHTTLHQLWPLLLEPSLSDLSSWNSCHLENVTKNKRFLAGWHIG